MINVEKVKEKYDILCETPSDIYQLLPYLLNYAKKCKHITEMGVRTPTSTYAFLAGNPDKMISYDIERSPGVDEVEKLAPGVFEFILKDVLEADIEETDFLFIDTYHTAAQLEQELLRHSGKVRRYIGFHDTNTFWENGEKPYAGISKELASPQGLKYAIKPFLAKGGWDIAFMTEKNNGLLIIERWKDGKDSIGSLLNRIFYAVYLPWRKWKTRRKELKAASSKKS